MTTTTIPASPAHFGCSNSEPALTAPYGFRPATAADFTNRRDGWVGPMIYGPELVNGRPETTAILTWAPEDGLTYVLDEDTYPDEDPLAAEDAFGRLEALLGYAALEAEATSPSDLARAFRASEDNFYNFDAPWDDTQDLVLNDRGEPTLDASAVIGGGVPIGLHLTISLEDFEGLGLDVHAEGENLELTGTREEVAAAADLLAEMGAKLKAFLDERPA